LEVEPAEDRRHIQIRDFMITERLLSFWEKDSRALADIPNDQSNVLAQYQSDTCRADMQPRPPLKEKPRPYKEDGASWITTEPRQQS
jgi:hypothetical protein